MANRRGKRKAPAAVARSEQALDRFNLLDRYECRVVLEGADANGLGESDAQARDAAGATRRRRPTGATAR